MQLQELKIRTDQVLAGMYVCRLDRPWTGAPFPLQGFVVDARDQLDWLHAHCESVWIDVERGRAPSDAPAPVKRLPKVAGDQLLGSVRYVDRIDFNAELPAARAAHDNASRLAARILEDVQAGRKLDAAEVRAAAEPIVQSVLRNADTLFWVNTLQRDGRYAYSHAINCCALAAAFGRHLGLPEPLLVELASGGLLLDVGKARLPQELLSRPGPIDAGAMAQVRTHVELASRILDESAGSHSDEVKAMIRTHHERWDGSGYPERLAGHTIPLSGRMAAIIDSFDAMTSIRPHAPAIARHEALQELYRNRDRLYQGELVEQFTGCLGVYPTGSLVELSTGEVAVVMTQNPSRRLRPQVMLLTDAGKRLRHPFTALDLMQQPEGIPIDRQINIVRPLPVGAHGLDPAELFL
jgi:HD-GYP domain-containing protein (c-di-GMP phosphodiesterase class II)